jgi:hypothetical protein
MANDRKLFREALFYLIGSDRGLEVIASCGDSQETLEIIQLEERALG